MRTWILTCSKDGIDIDHEETIHSNQEPTLTDCYAMAEKHGTSFWSLEEID